MRLEKRFKFKERYTIGLFFDLYNTTNTNKDITYSSSTGRKTAVVDSVSYAYSLFGSPTAIVGPRICRLGLHFEF